MAADNMMTYNPSMVKVALGTHIMSGYAEDTFIVIDQLDSGITSKAGCDGEIVRSVDPNNRYSIKLTLLPNSPTNNFLLNKYKQDKKDGTGHFPILINDITGAEKFSSAVAWVSKAASSTKGKEASNKEWTLETGQTEYDYIGGKA